MGEVVYKILFLYLCLGYIRSYVAHLAFSSLRDPFELMSTFIPNPAKKILIPQARIDTVHAPYLALAKKYNVAIDFYPFTSIASVPVSKFRKYKQDIIHKRAAFLFRNKVAIDHFFTLVEQIKVKLSEDTRYFCATGQLKHYLQKYILLKQRKVISGTKSIEDIFPKIKKFKQLNFIFPCSNARTRSLQAFFKTNNLSYKEIPTYQTNFNDLSNLSHEDYDLILFFSPLEVKAMSEQLPAFQPDGTHVAVFGCATATAVERVGWKAHIQAPSQEAPSLVTALELYFKKNNTL